MHFWLIWVVKVQLVIDWVFPFIKGSVARVLPLWGTNQLVRSFISFTKAKSFLSSKHFPPNAALFHICKATPRFWQLASLKLSIKNISLLMIFYLGMSLLAVDLIQEKQFLSSFRFLTILWTVLEHSKSWENFNSNPGVVGDSDPFRHSFKIANNFCSSARNWLFIPWRLDVYWAVSLRQSVLYGAAAGTRATLAFQTLL